MLLKTFAPVQVTQGFRNTWKNNNSGSTGSELSCILKSIRGKVRITCMLMLPEFLLPRSFNSSLAILRFFLVETLDATPFVFEPESRVLVGHCTKVV